MFSLFVCCWLSSSRRRVISFLPQQATTHFIYLLINSINLYFSSLHEQQWSKAGGMKAMVNCWNGGRLRRGAELITHKTNKLTSLLSSNQTNFSIWFVWWRKKEEQARKRREEWSPGQINFVCLGWGGMKNWLRVMLRWLHQANPNPLIMKLKKEEVWVWAACLRRGNWMEEQWSWNEI